MAISPNTNISGDIQRYEQQLPGAQTTYDSAKTEAEAKVRELNNLQLRDKNGNVIQCKTVDEWMKAFRELGPIKYANGNSLLGGPDDKNSVSNLCKVVCEKLSTATKTLEGLKENLTAAKAFDKLLETGDLMAAFMQLSMTRAKFYDGQVKQQVEEIKTRNETVKSLNNSLANQQNMSPKNDGAIKQIEGSIQKLNSDTQLQMLDVNDLVSKKMQSFDGMTSMLTKWNQMVQQLITNVGR